MHEALNTRNCRNTPDPHFCKTKSRGRCADAQVAIERDFHTPARCYAVNRGNQWLGNF